MASKRKVEKLVLSKFASRGEYMVALCPNVGADSEPEGDDNENELDIEMSMEEPVCMDVSVADVDELQWLNPCLNILPHSDDEDEVPVVDEGQELIDQEIPVAKASQKALRTPTKQARINRHPRSKVKPKPNYNWSSDDFLYPVDIEPDNFAVPTELKLPIDYFSYFFDNDIINLIVENTNLYSAQQTGKSINIDKHGIADFIAIEILMGVIKLPAYTDYWAQNLRYDKVASIMPLKKYQSIRRSIHFVNNEQMNDDRYFKVRPIVEHVRQKCLAISFEKRNSVDEMMIPYKGTKAGSRRQFLKNKPKRWGYKLFVRSGISGIVYDFILYGGDNTFRGYSFTDEEESLGLSGKVVVALSKLLPPCSAVYFDNFFTSFELVQLLRETYGILSLGTIRTNRLRGCNIESDKSLAKRGRGSYHQVVDNAKKLVLVKWQDNKSVLLTSSFADALPISKVQRFSKAEKKKIKVDCPNIVTNYNMHMGGVDLSDMLVSLYRTAFKTHKWYLSIFSHMIDISVNNSWLMYRRDFKLKYPQPTPNAKCMKLKDFRIKIADQLLLYNRRKVGRPSSNEGVPPKKVTPCTSNSDIAVRFDNVGHFPAYISRGRCRNCPNGKSLIMCMKCEIRLCLTKERNCFIQYHTR